MLPKSKKPSDEFAMITRNKHEYKYSILTNRKKAQSLSEKKI